MSKNQKFTVSFFLALTLHLSILALFGISFFTEPEVVKQKPLPEIIQASILDDETILEEADRLKADEQNKQLAQKQKQQKLENNRKKEQELFEKAKQKRLEEELKTQKLEQQRQENELKQKIMEKQRKEQEVKEKQKLEEIRKEKIEESARLAKIKKQKEEEKKRLDDLRVAEEKKREAEKQADQKRKQALIAKQKAEAAEKEAEQKRQAVAAQAQAEQSRKATITATVAIQQKVNARWIRPMSAKKGLNCTIRVKLLPSGDVMSASVIRSSGDSVFDRSAENAVRKASPLPVPEDRALFINSFRTFAFDFKPE